jgi:nickel transport protein
MMTSCRWLACIVVGIISLFAMTGMAHELRLVASVEGEQVVGRAYFEGAGGVAGASVLMIGADQQILGEVVTGAEGRFRFPIPKHHPLIFRVRTVDLHEAETTVRIEQMPIPPTRDSSLAEQAEIDRLREENTRLREELDRVQHEVRGRDVAGGVGLILGLFGLLALWRRVRP